VPTLAVELNGDAVHSIRAPDRFATTGHFSIALENLGRSTHVHLHFDDDLDRVCSVGETNHFVDGESTKRVHVTADAVDGTVTGKLKIVTGYGSNTRYVDVEVDAPTQDVTERVTVDERFTKPPERPPDPPLGQRVSDAVAAGVALALAIDSVIVSFAVGVVLTVSIAAVVLALA